MTKGKAFEGCLFFDRQLRGAIIQDSPQNSAKTYQQHCPWKSSSAETPKGRIIEKWSICENECVIQCYLFAIAESFLSNKHETSLDGGQDEQGSELPSRIAQFSVFLERRSC